MGKFEKGISGNPKGRPKGSSPVTEYRRLLNPHIPELLNVLVGKAKEGDLAAMRLVLERAFPVREAVVSELMEEIEELRRMLNERPANGADTETAALLHELDDLRRIVRDSGLVQCGCAMNSGNFAGRPRARAVASSSPLPARRKRRRSDAGCPPMPT